MQNSHVGLQQFINRFLGIKAFHTEDMFLFSVTLLKLQFYTSIAIHTHEDPTLKSTTTTTSVVYIRWYSLKGRSVMMISVHNNHIKFHKHQAIKICNSDFKN